MASCTREQLNKWNAKLANGFTLDLQHFLIWGEKSAVRRIDLPDGKILKATLEYRDARDDSHHYTGLHQPMVHLSIWTDRGNGMLSSHGMGASVKIGTVQSKRNFNNLAALSATIDDEKIMAWATEKMADLKKDTVM